MAGNIPFVNTESLASKTKNVRLSTEMSYLKRRFGSVKGVSHRKLMNGEQFKCFLRSYLRATLISRQSGTCRDLAILFQFSGACILRGSIRKMT